MKVHHGLATYRGGASGVNQGCAMWLPTFLQRGIHFFGERTEVWAFNNFVLFDRVHLPSSESARRKQTESCVETIPLPKCRMKFGTIWTVQPFAAYSSSDQELGCKMQSNYS